MSSPARPWVGWLVVLECQRTLGTSALRFSHRCWAIPVPDESNMSAFQVYIVIPICRVQQSPLVLVQTRDSRPPPIIEDASSIDQDITVITDLPACLQILNLDIVATSLLVPVRARNLVLGFHVVMETVLGCKMIEIVIYLLAACVYRGPVELRLEGPGVVMGWYVAGTTGVSVLIPGSGDFWVLFVHGQAEIGEVALQFICQ